SAIRQSILKIRLVYPNSFPLSIYLLLTYSNICRFLRFSIRNVLLQFRVLGLTLANLTGCVSWRWFGVVLLSLHIKWISPLALGGLWQLRFDLAIECFDLACKAIIRRCFLQVRFAFVPSSCRIPHLRFSLLLRLGCSGFIILAARRLTVV